MIQVLRNDVSCAAALAKAALLIGGNCPPAQAYSCCSCKLQQLLGATAGTGVLIVSTTVVPAIARHGHGNRCCEEHCNLHNITRNSRVNHTHTPNSCCLICCRKRFFAK
jgi:hypothetical protein